MELKRYPSIGCCKLCCVYRPSGDPVTNIDIQFVTDFSVYPKTTANDVIMTPVVSITSCDQNVGDNQPVIIELKKIAQLIDHNIEVKIVPLHSSTDQLNWRELEEGCEVLKDWIRFKTTHFSYFTVIAHFPPPTASLVIDPTSADSMHQELTIQELPGFKVEIPPGSVETAVEITATLYLDDDSEMHDESTDLQLATACVQLQPHGQQFAKRIPVQIPIPGYSEIVKENPDATLQLWYIPASPKAASTKWVLDDKTEWRLSQNDGGEYVVTVFTDHFSTFGIKWSQHISGLAKMIGSIFNHVQSLGRRCQVFMTHETKVESQVNFCIRICIDPFQGSLCEVPCNFHYILHDSGCSNAIEFKPGKHNVLMKLKKHLYEGGKEFSRICQLTEKYATMVEFDVDLEKNAESKLVEGAVLAHLSIWHKDIEEHFCNLIKVAAIILLLYGCQCI